MVAAGLLLGAGLYNKIDVAVVFAALIAAAVLVYRADAIRTLRMTCICKDWTARSAAIERSKGKAYPDALTTLTVDGWTPDEAEKLLVTRVRDWKTASTAPDSDLPECDAFLYGKKKDGSPKRCQDYCNFSDHCHQFKRAVETARRR